MTMVRSTLRSWSGRLGVVFVGVLVVLGGVAYATIPDANGVVNGCYNTVNGNLRVIDVAAGATKEFDEKCAPKMNPVMEKMGATNLADLVRMVVLLETASGPVIGAEE